MNYGALILLGNRKENSHHKKGKNVSVLQNLIWLGVAGGTFILNLFNLQAGAEPVWLTYALLVVSSLLTCYWGLRLYVMYDFGKEIE
jgi:hypothetical protein